MLFNKLFLRKYSLVLAAQSIKLAVLAPTSDANLDILGVIANYSCFDLSISLRLYLFYIKILISLSFLILSYKGMLPDSLATDL